MDKAKWYDKTEPLPEGEYMLVILSEDGKYLLRPRGWLHRVFGELRTVGNYGTGYAVKKYAIVQYLEGESGVMEDGAV